MWVVPLPFCMDIFNFEGAFYIRERLKGQFYCKLDIYCLFIDVWGWEVCDFENLKAVSSKKRLGNTDLKYTKYNK